MVMPGNSLNARIPTYKAALASGEVQDTYQRLVGVVQDLRTDFSRKYKGQYSIANLLHGYVDFTYFYLQNDYLKQRKLKLAIVLNHQQVHFELWLLGQTKDVQSDYWEKLRQVEWVNAQAMPRYSICEILLLQNPDFDHESKLPESIHTAFGLWSCKILRALEALE